MLLMLLDMLIIKLCLVSRIDQTSRAVQYTDGISAEGKTPPPTHVLGMTLSNLIVRLQ